ASCAGAGPALGDVPFAGGGAALDGSGLEDIGGADGAGARTALRHVAGAGSGTALDRRGLQRISGACGVRARARLGHVAVAGRGPALHGCRFEGIVGAGGPRPRAAFRHVAVSRRGPALDRRRLEGVRGTLCSRAGARLLDVARARGRATDRRGGREVIRRAGGLDTVACLRQVADTRRRAAYGTGVSGGMLTLHAGAVADVGGTRVAVVGADGTGGLARVGRTLRPVAVAELAQVTCTGRRPAHRARGGERVGRTIVGDPVAGLCDVAGPG